MVKEIIKQDINFLDKPLWFQNVRQDGLGSVWTDIEGYEYRTGYKLPDKVDQLILLYLIYKSQQVGYSRVIQVTKYEVLKKCSLPIKGDYYKRVGDSLKRWKNIAIEFRGTFYDGKRYLAIGFGIIEDYEINEETNFITITFNEKWLLKIKESQYYKYLNFEYYKALKRSLSRRLFELLCKTFKGRDKWSIGLVKLGTKLTLYTRTVLTKDGEKQVMYASDVLVAVKPAINEINRLSKQKDTIEKMGIHPDDLFTIDYKITGKSQERVINFKKIPVSVPAAAPAAPQLTQPEPPSDDDIQNLEIMEYVTAQIKKGHVKDPEAYAARCRLNGYGVKTAEQRAAEQAKIAADQEREARIAELRREADRLQQEADAEIQQVKDKVARQNALVESLTPEQDAELSRLAEQKIGEVAEDFEKNRYLVQKKNGETMLIDRYKRGLVEKFIALNRLKNGVEFRETDFF